MNWYTQVLGFEVEKDLQAYPDYQMKMAFLKLGDFHLELIEYANVYNPSEVLPNPDSYVGGVFKIGFAVQDIQKVYERLNNMEEVNMVAELGELPENTLPITWPTHYFLIQDPDGNYLQFFDEGATPTPAPWLFMVTVDSLEGAISWYTENIGFTHHQTLGEEGNQRAILARNNYVLELFEPAHVVKAADIPTDTTVLGVKKIAFAVEEVPRLAAQFEERPVEITMPLSPAKDITWATQTMIVKDPEGNWIQVFDSKK